MHAPHQPAILSRVFQHEFVMIIDRAIIPVPSRGVFLCQVSCSVACPLVHAVPRAWAWAGLTSCFALSAGAEGCHGVWASGRY